MTWDNRYFALLDRRQKPKSDFKRAFAFSTVSLMPTAVGKVCTIPVGNLLPVTEWSSAVIDTLLRSSCGVDTADKTLSTRFQYALS